MNIAVAGSVEDFTPEKIEEIKLNVARITSLDVSKISVTVTPASVNIGVLIDTDDSTSNAAAANALTTAMPDASTTSSELGVTATSAPSIEAVVDVERLRSPRRPRHPLRRHLHRRRQRRRAPRLS
jgi:hypothetical protein